MATLTGAQDRRAAAPVPPLGSTLATMSRVIEHRALQYRRTYRASLFSSFGIPVLFLTAMGLGLGGYVNTTNTAGLEGLTYLQFLAPGLLAATVMQTGSFESAFPILGGLQWNKIFHAMFATPIRPRDIALGNIVWIAFRLTLVAVVFTIVIVLFGARALAADGLRDPRFGAVRARLRHPDHGLHGHATDARQVRHDFPIRDHAALPVQRHVLTRSTASRRSSSRSPGSRRCGTAWTCAGC